MTVTLSRSVLMKDLASKKSHILLGRIHQPYPRRCARTFSQNEPADLILVKTPKDVSIMEIYAILAVEPTIATAIAAMSHHVSIVARIFLLIIATGF